jgi:predicted nucleotidyltransferase
MSPILEHTNLVEMASACRRFRVTRLGVFGSVARGVGSEVGDVDLRFEGDAEGRIPDLRTSRTI